MNKPPAFQFYPDDFLGGVADMTQAEVGAYILLLCQQWNRGSIPVEPGRQQMIAKGAVSDHVRSKFNPGPDGLLRNERLEIERKKQADFREMQRQKGILSAQARASARQPRFNHGSTTAQPSGEPHGQPKGNSPSPSSYPTKLIRGKALTGENKELADRLENALSSQWVNDAPKWVNRIKAELAKVRRVVAEVESGIKEKRIKTTPAQYAEQVWKEFA